MRILIFEKFLLLFSALIILTIANELSPHNNNNRKSKYKLDNEEEEGYHNANENTEKTPEPPEANEKMSSIKIIKAPDLRQDKEDNKRQTDPDIEMRKFIVNMYKKQKHERNTYDELLHEEEKQIVWTPPKLTQAEQDDEDLYEAGMKILNKTRSDKTTAYEILLQAADRGHFKSQVQLAWAYLLGNPFTMDIPIAVNTFFRLGDIVPETHMGLAFLHATGIGTEVSQSKALLHYTMAAANDDPWAQMALGYRYWAGVTVPTNCETALGFYRKVATKVATKITFSGGAAVHRVRLLDELENSNIDSNDVIQYYQHIAEKGDISTQVGLGQLHYQGGHGIPVDHVKALEYFKPAANAGNAAAMAYIGKIYLEGSEHIKADNETAFNYFMKAAELGNPVGQSGLGLMYLQGKGVTKDTAKAYSYFTQAADQGWVDGQLQLGNMYFSGIGVKRDFKLANKYFNLASQSGHILAYYNLGQMHAVGLGMMRSCPTAVELFKNVAERGQWSERLMLAHQDYKAYRYNSAFMQYALAAELGYEVAQSNAAFLLDRGEVTLFNNRNEERVRALQYWGRAAAQGYSAAQVRLGDYHYYGLGTAIDYEVAASHYRMASEQQHNAQAMFNLGYMHEQGLGMAKDWHLAKRCYDLAGETSADARVPVALALLKLSLLFKVEALRNGPFGFIFELDKNIESNWDLYLITALTLLLGMIIYWRRPQPGLQTPQQPPRSSPTTTSATPPAPPPSPPPQPPAPPQNPPEQSTDQSQQRPDDPPEEQPQQQQQQ